MPDDRSLVEILTIDIEERDGLFYATCPALPEMMLAHHEIEVVMRQIPVIVKAIYEHDRGRIVSVLPATERGKKPSLPMHRPWAVLPSAMLAQAHA